MNQNDKGVFTIHAHIHVLDKFCFENPLNISGDLLVAPHLHYTYLSYRMVDVVNEHTCHCNKRF